MALAIALLYGVALLLIGFWPTHVDAGMRGPLDGTIAWFHRNGLRWLDYDVIEAAANVALFIPFGAIMTLLVGFRRWWLAAMLGVAASAVIELGQWLMLPHRTPSIGDVGMNSIGALIGAGGAALIAVSMRQRPMPR